MKVWRMLWILVLIYTIHNIQASLPSFSEILSRTRWCWGEGTHCPIFLPFNVPSCCKPYVCTIIPKTRKPTRFLKFTDYKDYRCLLPPTIPRQNVSNTTNYKEQKTENSIVYNSKFKKYSEIANNNTNIYSNNLQDEATTIINNTSTIKSFNDNKLYEESDHTFQENKIKAPKSKYKNKSLPRNLTRTANDSIYLKQVFKRSLINISSEFIEDINAKRPVNLSCKENTKSSLLYSGSNLTSTNYKDSFNQSNKNVIQEEISSNHSHDWNNETSNKDVIISRNILLQSGSTEVNISRLADLTSSITKTEITDLDMLKESDQDWTSSDMNFDTRPLLYKVVTITPFKIKMFDSVEAINLNLSQELSE